MRTGLEIALQLRRSYPEQWEIDNYIKLLGSDAVLQAIRDGRSYTDILDIYSPELDNFKRRRLAYLIYP